MWYCINCSLDSKSANVVDIINIQFSIFKIQRNEAELHLDEGTCRMSKPTEMLMVFNANALEINLTHFNLKKEMKHEFEVL